MNHGPYLWNAIQYQRNHFWWKVYFRLSRLDVQWAEFFPITSQHRYWNNVRWMFVGERYNSMKYLHCFVFFSTREWAKAFNTLFLFIQFNWVLFFTYKFEEAQTTNVAMKIERMLNAIFFFFGILAFVRTSSFPNWLLISISPLFIWSLAIQFSMFCIIVQQFLIKCIISSRYYNYLHIYILIWYCNLEIELLISESNDARKIMSFLNDKMFNYKN